MLFSVSDGIALVALAVSLVSVWYCHRNFRMSRHEFLLRRRRERQACFRAEAFHVVLCKYRIVVTNIGEAEARDVSIDFGSLAGKGLTVVNADAASPCAALSPGAFVDVFAIWGDGRIFRNVPLEISWSDDFKNLNRKTLSVEFPLPSAGSRPARR